jgi:signal-transduction protein with cAMP-binding, CBS, and nucleotidyltransferase domain
MRFTGLQRGGTVMQTTVQQLLQKKSGQIWSVAPETSIREGVRMMRDQDIGAVLVMDDQRLAGIVTERDFARRFVPGETSPDAPIHTIMTERVIGVRPDQALIDCMRLMSDRHVRHLPVVRDQQIIGMVSIRDVVEHLVADQQFLIEQLESYING